MSEQFGIITSSEKVTSESLELDYGDGLGYRRANKNPIWFSNPVNKTLKGRIKITQSNVSVAIYINGFLSNSILNDENWLIDIDGMAGTIVFEWKGNTSIFDNSFLLQINLV